MVRTMGPHMKHHHGAASELDVASILLRLGCEVFTSSFGFSEVDLVALTPSGATARIQVKSASTDGRSKGRVKISTARQDCLGGKSVPYTRVDFFVACRAGMYWVFPASECMSTKKRCGADSPFLNAWHLIMIMGLVESKASTGLSLVQAEPVAVAVRM